MTSFWQTDAYAEISHAVHGTTSERIGDVLVVRKHRLFRGYSYANSITKLQAEQMSILGWPINQGVTRHIDLVPSEIDIFAQFEHNARQGIRKAQRDGICVMECLDEPEYRLRFAHEWYGSKQKPMPRSDIYHWRLGRQHGYRFFIALGPHDRVRPWGLEVGGGSIVQATLGVIVHEGVATEIMSCRTQHAHATAQDLLHWEVMKACKAAGAYAFDLAGHEQFPQSEKQIGIRRFKQKFGGREVPTWRVERPERLGATLNASPELTWDAA